MTLSISYLILIKASANLSNSALSSDSVGSIIKVPGTGQLIVGAWNPKSYNLLATSSSVIPDFSFNGLMSIMNS